LRAYLFAVRLMLCVERFAQRPPEHITPSVAGDLKFHVGTLLASKVSGVAKQDPRKLDGDSFRELSEDDIAEAYDIVIRLAREVQRDLSVVENDMDRVAKSTELTDALVAYLRGDDERRERG